MFFDQQHPPRTPTTNNNTRAPAPARIHSALGLAVIAHDQCCSARNATCAALAPLGPTYTAARAQHFSLSCTASRAVTAARTGLLAACMAPFFSSSGFPPFSWPAVTAARGGLAARACMAPFFSSSSSGFPPFSWPAVLSFYLYRVAPRATPPASRMHARLLASARTTDERTMRRAVRRRG